MLEIKTTDLSDLTDDKLTMKMLEIRTTDLSDLSDTIRRSKASTTEINQNNQHFMLTTKENHVFNTTLTL